MYNLWLQEVKNVLFVKIKYTKDLPYGTVNSATHHSTLDVLKDGFKS